MIFFIIILMREFCFDLSYILRDSHVSVIPTGNSGHWPEQFLRRINRENIRTDKFNLIKYLEMLQQFAISVFYKYTQMQLHFSSSFSAREYAIRVNQSRRKTPFPANEKFCEVFFIIY